MPPLVPFLGRAGPVHGLQVQGCAGPLESVRGAASLDSSWGLHGRCSQCPRLQGRWVTQRQTAAALDSGRVCSMDSGR